MAQTATALRAPVAFAPESRSPLTAVPPRAGWFPDPERRATTRFFDGGQWTEHTRGPAPLAALTDAAKARTVEARSYGRFSNRPASASIAVGALSILVPVFVLSVVGLVLGVRGLRRAKQSLAHHGRERALAGIALAMVGVATSAVTVVALVGMLMPSFERAQHAAQVAAVHAAVAQHVRDGGGALAALSCPPARPGVPVLCSVATLGGRHLKVHVLQPPDGSAVQVTDVAPPARPAHPARPRHR